MRCNCLVISRQNVPITLISLKDFDVNEIPPHEGGSERELIHQTSGLNTVLYSLQQIQVGPTKKNNSHNYSGM